MLLLSIDQGTSSTKACVFEPPGVCLATTTVRVNLHRGQDHSFTQNPHELVASCRAAVQAVLRDANVRPSQITGVSLANQGESFLLIDPRGRPLTPVISWQDRNTGDVLLRPPLVEHARAIRASTGLPWHAEFVAPRAVHRLERLGAEAREARIATLDTWLIQQLNPTLPFVTDRATASRTMLVGLEDEDWNDELLCLFGLHREMLADIVPSDSPGASLVLDGVELPLWASGYDMGLALLGHGCLAAGETKATFGTCLGVMSASGQTPLVAPGLVTAIAYTRAGRPAFALDGEIAAAGALVEWALALGIADSLSELDALAASVPHSRGVVLVPAILGLGAPHWNGSARAMITGLSADSGSAELAHAVYDAIAWSLRDVCDALGETGVVVKSLRVDGGLSSSRTLMQRCADVCGVPVLISSRREATAYGAASLAMLAQGLVTETDVCAIATGGAETIAPLSEPDPAEGEAWARAVAHVLDRANNVVQSP